MELNIKKIKRNFRKIFGQATPEILSDGMAWYGEACEWSRSIVKSYNVDMEIVVGVLSALSPAVEWELNKRQAENLIRGYLILSDVKGVVVSTYKRQLKKSIQILDLHETNYRESEILDILGRRAYKTRAFYHNILNPYDKSFVTVDSHIWNAAGLVTKTWINKGEYATISKIIVELSDEVGMRPCQFQSVVWLAYKELDKGLPI